jgi:hypothetical protein
MSAWGGVYWSMDNTGQEQLYVRYAMTDPKEDFHPDSVPVDEPFEPPADEDDGDEPETGGEA